MGIMTTLFGGTERKQNPGAQKYIDALFGFDPTMYGGLGLGKAAKWAREDLKGLRAGNDISTIAGLSGIRNAINSSFAAGDAARNRDLAANFALSNQPALLAAQQAEFQNKSNADKANATANAVAGFYDQQQQLLNQAFQNRAARQLQAAGLKLGALSNAADAFNNSWYNQQVGGIIPGVAGLISALTGGSSISSLFNLFGQQPKGNQAGQGGSGGGN